MPLSAGTYRGNMGSRAYPPSYQRQFDRRVVTELSGLGVAVPPPHIRRIVRGTRYRTMSLAGITLRALGFNV